MKRRDFLKALGFLVVAPGAALKVVKAASSKRYSLFAKLAKASQGIVPIIVDGKEYYVVLMHPRQEYSLRVAHAKDKYKHEQWLVRHNRWLKKQGKPPYIPTNSEAGQWDGVRLIERR